MKNDYSSIEVRKILLAKPKEEQSFTKLIPQTRIHEEGEDWHRSVLSDIESRVGDDPDFPCVFSKNAFQKGLLKFIFVNTIEISGIQHLAEGLTEYVEISRGWNGNLNTAYPLIVAFSLDAIKAQSIDGYDAFGWNVLQKLHDVDPAPWPTEVPTDPNSPSWSMCFNGMPIFCNMSHPAHRVRRSRNLGEHFLFIINPRERFDIVAGDTPSGRKVRSNIRNRIARFDGAAHCLQLASYGAGGIEWWQYGIIEDNIERTDKCPFKFMKR
jgi:FPC/CPF motif-containing protein YcgG